MAMRRGPVKLPPSITLQAIPVMDADQVRAALNATRANVHWWRKHDGFPKALRQGNSALVSTAAIAAWATAQNIKVIWV